MGSFEETLRIYSTASQTEKTYKMQQTPFWCRFLTMAKPFFITTLSPSICAFIHKKCDLPCLSHPPSPIENTTMVEGI